MRGALSAALVATTIAAGTVALNAKVSSSETKRIAEAATVLREIHAVPDKDIPQDLWDRANCVAVIPGLKKAAFMVGGEFGKGLLSCRHAGAWSAPVFMELGKGSFGFQIGAQSIDLVLLVMNDNAIEKLLQDKVTLGAEASVAAGPVGRDARAATDAQLKAEILSYSRAQGLFAGIDLSGGVLRPDKSDNADLYGASLNPHDVLMGVTIKAPAEVQPFMQALQHNGPVGTTGLRK